LSLTNQSIKGAVWTFIDIFINKGVYFAATIILAGILGPTEFGLIGMITIFISLGTTLIDSGMSTSVLRLTEPTDQDYSTIFLTGVIVSIVVYFSIYALAPYIAGFYNQELLISIIRVYCLGFIIIAFKSVHLVKLSKNMEFRKMTILNIPGNLISVVVAIYMGYNGYNVWSLVALFLVNQIISTVLYWLFIKWKPLFKFDLTNFKFHFNFGYKLLLSAQLNVVFDNIYNIIIGKYYSVNTLGHYERAYTFNNYPVSILSGIIAKVSLPSFTQIKDDTLRLKNAYKKIMLISFFISCFGLGFAAIIAEPLFQIILGNEWMPAVPLFQILCISYVFYPIHSLNINVLTLFGRSDLFLLLEVVKKVVILLAIVIGFNFGILGLVWSSVFSSIIALLINTHFSGRFLNYGTISQLRDLFPVIMLLIVSILFLMLFSYYYHASSNIEIIVTNFLVGLVTVVGLSEIFQVKVYNIIKDLIKENFRK
jgi:O-antigen/teichoic acid export membrane protein